MSFSLTPGQWGDGPAGRALLRDLPQPQHELALIKVRATESKRGEILRIIELYKGRVLDVGPESVIIEHSGTEQEIDSLVAVLGGFGIREMVRTGTIALGRGSGAIDVEAILRAGPEPAVTQAAIQTPTKQEG